MKPYILAVDVAKRKSANKNIDAKRAAGPLSHSGKPFKHRRNFGWHLE